MYEFDADSASAALDSLLAQLTGAANQRLREAVAAANSDGGDVVAVVRSVLDGSSGSVVSLVGGSSALFEVLLRRLRAMYERTADGCVAQLALQVALQAAAAQPTDNSDKVSAN